MLNYALFGFIVCCFLISMFRREGEDSRDVFFLRIGMFFTVAADLMMIIYQLNILSLFFFIAVQLIYNIRFTGFNRTVATAALAVVFFSASFFITLPAEIHLSIFYAVCILSTVVGSFSAYKKRPSRTGIFAVIGMTLFLLCDINVALFNIFAAYDIHKLFQVLIWIFYLPSQLLISLSGKKS